MLAAEPSLPKLRRLSAEPSCKQSRTATQDLGESQNAVIIFLNSMNVVILNEHSILACDISRHASEILRNPHKSAMFVCML